MSGSCPVGATVCRDAHETVRLYGRFIDAQYKELERLRTGIKALAEDPTWHRGMYGCPRDMVSTDRLIALLSEDGDA